MHQTLGQILSLGYGLKLCPHQVAPHALEQCKVVKVACAWGRPDGCKRTQEPAVCRGISKLLNSNSAQHLAQLHLTEHHQHFHKPVSPLHDPATSRANARLLRPCLLELTNGEALRTLTNMEFTQFFYNYVFSNSASVIFFVYTSVEAAKDQTLFDFCGRDLGASFMPFLFNCLCCIFYYKEYRPK